MAKRPQNRYPSCQHLADDLQRWLQDPPSTPVGQRGMARMGSTATRPAARRACRRWRFLVVGALLLCLVGVLLVHLYQGILSLSEAPNGKRPGSNLSRLVSLPPEKQKEVDTAVRRAAEFLQQQQQANGSWTGSAPVGITSLGSLALLEAGLKPTEPALQKAAAYIRKTASSITSNATYQLSLAILFLDRLGDAHDNRLIHEFALRLVAAQTPQGGWAYECPPLSKDEHEQLFTALKELRTKKPAEVIRSLAKTADLSPRVRNLAVLQTEADRPVGRADNSNTQFAILALLAAQRHDLPLDRCLALSAKRFRSTQKADGRWTYNGQSEITPIPTMTCAGLLGVAAGFGLEDKGKPVGRPEDDPAVKKALEHLSKSIDQPGGKEGKLSTQQNMYFLWGVERVAVLYQLETINGKKWYPWGVDILMTNQLPKGAWRGVGVGSTEIVDTCFAILFLQQSNLTGDLTDRLIKLRAAPGTGR
jgi:hypothetical protein